MCNKSTKAQATLRAMAQFAERSESANERAAIELRVAREMYAEQRAADPILGTEDEARAVFDHLAEDPENYLTEEIWPTYLAGGLMDEQGAKAWRERLAAALKAAGLE